SQEVPAQGYWVGPNTMFLGNIVCCPFCKLILGQSTKNEVDPRLKWATRDAETFLGSTLMFIRYPNLLQGHSQWDEGKTPKL
ncbi:hypothetical protein PJI17_31160, partial [Mycobacterium kansasii]